MNFIASDNSIVKVARPLRLQWAGHASRAGKTRKAKRILMRKSLYSISIGKLLGFETKVSQSVI